MESFDVVVIGAGLSGLHAARAASRRGLSVLLVDRKPRVDAGIQTTGMFVRRSPEGYALPETCLGPPVRRVRLLGPKLTGIALERPHDEIRIGRMGRLHMHLLADAERSGTTVRLKTRYVGSEIDDASTRVGLETGGRLATVRARYVLGADGAVSSVAADLGLGENSVWMIGIEDVYAVRTQDVEPRLTFVLDPSYAPGSIGWVANDGDEIHVGLAGYAERFDPAAALEAFTDRMGRIEPIDRAMRFERRTGLIPAGGVLARIANRHGALVGDAAGAPSAPFARGLLMRRVVAATRQRPIAYALILALRLPPLRAMAANACLGRRSSPGLRRPSELAKSEQPEF